MSIKGLREARKLQTANPDTASFDAIADAASEARNGRVLRNASTPQSHSESTHSQSPKRQKGKTNGSTEPQPDATRLSIQAESLRTRLAEKEQLEEKLKAELNAQARKVERLKVERDELKDHLTSVKCDFQDQIAKRDEEITRLQDIIESLKDDSVSLPPR
jgi:predicted RNase H-like nuclease (RuvC/YqgF family)